MSRKFILQIILSSIIILFLYSCKYTKPLMAVKVSSITNDDTSSVKNTETISYNYLSLRNFGKVNGYTKKVLYNSKGKKSREIYTKKTPLKMSNEQERYYTMIKYFDSNGNISHIDRKIKQQNGNESEYIENMTIYYTNGRRSKVVNKLK